MSMHFILSRYICEGGFCCFELWLWWRAWRLQRVGDTGAWRAETVEMVTDATLLLLLLLPFMVLGELGYHVQAFISQHSWAFSYLCMPLSLFALGVICLWIYFWFWVSCIESFWGCKDECWMFVKSELYIYFIIATMCTAIFANRVGPAWYSDVILGDVVGERSNLLSFFSPSASPWKWFRYQILGLMLISCRCLKCLVSTIFTLFILEVLSLSMCLSFLSFIKFWQPLTASVCLNASLTNLWWSSWWVWENIITWWKWSKIHDTGQWFEKQLFEVQCLGVLVHGVACKFFRTFSLSLS